MRGKLTPRFGGFIASSAEGAHTKRWIHIAICPSLFLASFVISVACAAQVITPLELQDPTAQRLQQRHLNVLMTIGSEIEEHKFPYPFYFSRVLDVDLPKVPLSDQRSIRFDRYKNETVLEITGNYYAAYSADKMDIHARVKETFNSVIMPLLAAEVPRFPDDSEFSAFAIEVSHHVRQKVMGVTAERPENIAVIIPVDAAQKLVDAKTNDQKQAAILDAQIFVNGDPFSLWLIEGTPSEQWKERYTAKAQPRKDPDISPPTPAAPTVSVNLVKASGPPMRLLTPTAMATLQREHQDSIDILVKSLDEQAHFFPYAPPTFIGFRQRAYLQLSVNTAIDAPGESSRYKLAALAFDEHVSRLIRPILTYFATDENFDGISFSSIVRPSGGTKAESVEFFFSFRAMRCFADYECTGQQLLDSGTVVINGERAALDLQIAEGKN